MSRFIWVLDPGHGGLLNDVYQTSGKRSPIWSDGSVYYEGVGNRQIAKKVGDALLKLNIPVVYTVDPSNPVDVSLLTRMNTVNNLPNKNKILVSIHSNGASAESASGWEIFTSPGQTQSDKIADIFYNEFASEFKESKFRKDLSDGDFDKENPLYVTKQSNCPAVLLENFFMTNEKECKEILMTEAGQDRIVKAIVNSIVLIEQTGIPK